MLFEDKDLETLFSKNKSRPKNDLEFIDKDSSHNWWQNEEQSKTNNNHTEPRRNIPMSQEEDSIILIKKPKRKIGRVSLAVGIIIFIFLVLNGPIVIKNLNWWFVTDYQNKDWVTSRNSLVSANEDSIIIEKLGVRSPIIWDAPEAGRYEAMTQGVVATDNQIRPGQDGVINLIGQSNDYWWNSNPYGQVFALLNHLVAGDQIIIQDKGKIYNYLVTNMESTIPSQQLLTGGNTLVLITSSPTGSTQKRLFVIARLVLTPNGS